MKMPRKNTCVDPEIISLKIIMLQRMMNSEALARLAGLNLRHLQNILSGRKCRRARLKINAALGVEIFHFHPSPLSPFRVVGVHELTDYEKQILRLK